jgi:hypothetical protein
MYIVYGQEIECECLHERQSHMQRCVVCVGATGVWAVSQSVYIGYVGCWRRYWWAGVAPVEGSATAKSMGGGAAQVCLCEFA